MTELVFLTCPTVDDPLRHVFAAFTSPAHFAELGTQDQWCVQAGMCQWWTPPLEWMS